MACYGDGFTLLIGTGCFSRNQTQFENYTIRNSVVLEMNEARKPYDHQQKRERLLLGHVMQTGKLTNRHGVVKRVTKRVNAVISRYK
jgi:hypothetical protein